MAAFASTRRSSLFGICAACALVTVLVALGGGCETGGEEGDRCNALVLQDECNAGLHCTLATCSVAYCCPRDRSSTDPNCNGAGCPDETDAGGDESATDAPAEGSSADADADTG
jgi:hypothetical protein